MKWGFRTWECDYRFEALGEVIEEPDGYAGQRPGAHRFGADTFDTLKDG